MERERIDESMINEYVGRGGWANFIRFFPFILQVYLVRTWGWGRGGAFRIFCSVWVILFFFFVLFFIFFSFWHLGHLIFGPERGAELHLRENPF